MGQSFTVAVGNEKMQLRLNDRIHLFKDSWECKRHCNADFELHMILGGSCLLEIEDRQFSLTAPSAVIIPPGQYHLPHPQGDGFERFTLSFSLEQGPLRQQLDSSGSFQVTQEAERLCRDIFRECANSTPFRRQMLQALLLNLTVCCLRCLGVSEPVLQKEDAHSQEPTQPIDDFFELHMADDVGAEELAASLHISRRQLDRVLQKTYGMGFREKRIRTRMEHAAWLLRNSDEPIYRIAEAVGYASETAFYQAFRERFGQTPAQYRSQLKK